MAKAQKEPRVVLLAGLPARAIRPADTAVKNIVGKKVAEARGRLRPPLTQDGLSGRLARIGVHLDRAAIAKIETNRRRVLDYELKALAGALRVHVTWLLGGEL